MINSPVTGVVITQVPVPVTMMGLTGLSSLLHDVNTLAPQIRVAASTIGRAVSSSLKVFFIIVIFFVSYIFMPQKYKFSSN